MDDHHGRNAHPSDGCHHSHCANLTYLDDLPIRNELDPRYVNRWENGAPRCAGRRADPPHVVSVNRTTDLRNGDHHANRDDPLHDLPDDHPNVNQTSLGFASLTASLSEESEHPSSVRWSGGHHGSHEIRCGPLMRTRCATCQLDDRSTAYRPCWASARRLANQQACPTRGDRNRMLSQSSHATLRKAYPSLSAREIPDDPHSWDVQRTACARILRVNYLLLASPFPSMYPTVGAMSPQTTKATRRWPLLKNCPAASYSPTQSPVQYHRR